MAMEAGLLESPRASLESLASSLAPTEFPALGVVLGAGIKGAMAASEARDAHRARDNSRDWVR